MSPSPIIQSNSIAKQAANELSALPDYAGPRDSDKKVTPELLFRGASPARPSGPMCRNSCCCPRCLARCPIMQQYQTNKARRPISRLQPSGVPAGPERHQHRKKLTQLAQPLYLHDGRGLAAYTHDDVLYEAYFIAYLVLNALKGEA